MSSPDSIQQEKNEALIATSRYMRESVTSDVLPLSIDITSATLDDSQVHALQAIEIEAAHTAIKSLASLATIGELDHLGGGLDLIPALALTAALTDYEKVEFTIEHAHTSIGYYSVLAAYGFLDTDLVINDFRRGLDIAGHVSWVPGGTQLNGGRLGVMVPVAVGQALGKRAKHGDGAWVITHCGDAGWISGQALNGFNCADLHDAPITFVMHRNGIQLSGTNKQVMDKDPRPIIESQGITIIELDSFADTHAMYKAYHDAWNLAQQGRPSMLYPTGYKSTDTERVDLNDLGRRYNIAAETAEFAAKNNVAMDTEIWIPGAMMSYRDVLPMLECIFHVNNLPGGEGHHDGHMKGRDEAEVLANPMMQITPAQQEAIAALRGQPQRTVVTTARPKPGSPNLVLSAESIAAVELPPAGDVTSARAGIQAGYAAVAKSFPEQTFVVSCDLNPSTKLDKAVAAIPANQAYEVSIEEQVATLLANGLAMSGNEPQLNVISTFSAFFDGLAREGFEMWRYQRNLTGANEGLNVTFHLSHVGACTGRDHFSGWSLDWVGTALTYLPYIHRFYTPADARAAFLAVRDLAAHYGAHVVGVPRDNLPVLEKQDGSGALWEADSEWEAVTCYRTYDGADKAILALGAPASLAAEAAEAVKGTENAADVYVVNGLPLPANELADLFGKYRGGIVTIEDNLIGCRASGIRGFASIVSAAAYDANGSAEHVGITDPRIAPSAGHYDVWEHFGITKDAVVAALQRL